jgi:hypothetical protein
MPERIVTCRVLKSFDTQCTAEAIDPDGEVLICVRHAAKVMRTVQAAEAVTTIVDTGLPAPANETP